ncbi:hypothetical protein [Methyloversatilis discipulorum]|uniref:hypothetical protein n=1 Tax=Methyloversatilis discipulorum TaxID=1119528 RepID=UPI0004ACD5FB|nr:hypothetical protein [Methyloversatilis discipulorum]
MITRRLELALERLQHSDWNRFERTASVFLATEFDDLRTVATPSGDEGRDAELFSPNDEPKVVIQYSVASDWRAKINATVRRLKDTLPNSLVLIYLTNQTVGADSDDLKKTLRTKYGLALDIRDRHWFIERVNASPQRQHAAEELATVIVDPYLSSVGVGPYVKAELSAPEAIAAATFLGLQWQDDVRDKGLTKLAFEALVRAALVNTSSANRIGRAAVHTTIKQFMPNHPESQVAPLVDSALKRLEKHTVKHWQKEDEFCLAHEEIQRLNGFRVEAALAESNLADAIQKLCSEQLSQLQIAPDVQQSFALCLRNALDGILFERSQAFSVAVQSGNLSQLADTDFDSVLLPLVARSTFPKTPHADWVLLLRRSVRDILTSDDQAFTTYLRSLADAYTLLAFLKQTPDVQGAVEKMFSHGILWLDASVVLPLLGDTLAEDEEEIGRFSRMIEAARDANLKLFVTSGVIEEVERHMNRALTCARLTQGHWEGSVPYLLERYVVSGRSPASFSSWLENFRGEARPLQDIAEYLHERFGITERSLETESAASSSELRNALQKIWLDRYERRKEKYGALLDDMAINRLIGHDIECYCGIVQLRSHEKPSPFGYSAWWLTVDRQTFDLKGRLRPLMNEAPPDSPVMSADFLVNYLAFGPVRRHVTKSKESHLPLLMVLGGATSLTPDLMAEAESIRAQLKEMPERVVRRQVRDYLDRAKSRIGPIAKMGINDVDNAPQALRQ